MNIQAFDAVNRANNIQKQEVLEFLFKHLGKYGDPKSAILKCIEYALKERTSFGGFVLVARKDDQVVGATVINHTGMEGYIPENILVYIATHEDYRGQGIGKKLMKEALKKCKGDVALHVEPDNPAKFLYEKLGFTNKYLEMRYQK